MNGLKCHPKHWLFRVAFAEDMVNGFGCGENFDAWVFDVSEHPIHVAVIKNISRLYGIGMLTTK